MEQKPKLMTPFDMLVTSSSLYTLKLMLPFAPASIQRSLAIYIKFSELKATMEHFYGFLNTDHPGSVLEQLKSCLSPEEQTQMSQMEDLMNMMEMMQVRLWLLLALSCNLTNRQMQIGRLSLWRQPFLVKITVVK